MTEFFVVRRVLKFRYKVLLGILVGGLILLFRPIIESCAVAYVVEVDSVSHAAHLVVESWDGNYAAFEAAHNVAQRLGDPVLWAVLHEGFATGRKRTALMHNAWAVGIDTSELRIILVKAQDPKTLLAAQTVIDTVRRNNLTEFVVLSGLFHTARSRNLYRRFADPHGIMVHVLGHSPAGLDTENWTGSGLGLSFVFMEVIKKLYYDLFVW